MRNLMPELANAPDGYCWTWRRLAKKPSCQTVAHLIAIRLSDNSPLDPFQGMHWTLCAKRKRGRGSTVAFQVGGVTQIPCPKCQEIARLEIAERGE